MNSQLVNKNEADLVRNDTIKNSNNYPNQIDENKKVSLSDNNQNLIDKNKSIEKVEMRSFCNNPNEIERLMIKHEQNHTSYSTIEKSKFDTKMSSISIELDDQPSIFSLYKGLIYMLLSCVFKSLFSILSKYAMNSNKDLSSYQLLFFRNSFMCLICVFVTFIIKTKLFSSDFIQPNKIFMLFLRTIFAIASMSLVIYSLKHMYVSDLYSVYYVYPAFLIIFSVIFLNERITKFDILCLLGCFLGALLVIKPSIIFKRKNNIQQKEELEKEIGLPIFYVSLVIFAALLKAIEDFIVKDIGKYVHFLAFPFMYTAVGIIIFPIPMIIFDSVYPSFSKFELIILFSIGLCTFAYISFLALGFQNENAGRVSMINYLQIVFMYLSDLFLFNKKLEIFDLIGTLLIFGLNFTNGLLKTLNRKKKLDKYINNYKNDL